MRGGCLVVGCGCNCRQWWQGVEGYNHLQLKFINKNRINKLGCMQVVRLSLIVATVWSRLQPTTTLNNVK